MTDKTTDASSTKPTELKPKSPYVFLSHDTKDADIAEAFSRLLSSVTAGVLKSFRSSDRKGGQRTIAENHRVRSFVLTFRKGYATFAP